MGRRSEGSDVKEGKTHHCSGHKHQPEGGASSHPSAWPCIPSFAACQNSNATLKAWATVKVTAWACWETDREIKSHRRRQERHFLFLQEVTANRRRGSLAGCRRGGKGTCLRDQRLRDRFGRSKIGEGKEEEGAARC